MANKATEPLRHLSVYEKKLLLSMVPTRDERQRMAKARDPQTREGLIIQFLLERRAFYEDSFRSRCATEGVETPNARHLMSEERLRRYAPIMSHAAAHASERRIKNPDADLELRHLLRHTDNLPGPMAQPSALLDDDDDDDHRPRQRRM
jgi:hypothetical protein